MSALCRKRHVVNFRFREIQFATVHITFITLNTQSGVEGLIGQEKRQEKGTGYFFLRRDKREPILFFVLVPPFSPVTPVSRGIIPT